MPPFGQVVFLLLVHLVVADESLVRGVDALALPVVHAAAPLPAMILPFVPPRRAGSGPCPSNWREAAASAGFGTARRVSTAPCASGSTPAPTAARPPSPRALPRPPPPRHPGPAAPPPARAPTVSQA